ncbi:GNAT family N-acetyltransferase [Pseudomonas sp. SZMC_28357]|uniref:GNAT family N-acetyltransferase n=1 Tax=Pseudomonas sp. SZMC_28357 TaxID=3074380 RepID=UPI002870EA66|nr:GNAT family N-acetyltransferase [Pseudomonas sp. SZMC_28357]MDR9749897.1 GNAT family N-acetyltransferase [Pseudomonas sp. SZMC_28357]
MKWPDPTLISFKTMLQEGYTLAQLSRNDVEPLTHKILDWHPNLRYGDGSRFAKVDYYLNCVSLKHETTRDTVVYVGRKDDDLVCMVCVDRDCYTNSIYGRLGVVDPAHRRSGLGVVVMELIEYTAVSQHMANIYTYATLHDSAVQHLLERTGYRPIGIIPDRDREFIESENEIMRVAEVLYVKSLPQSERILTPSPENMTPAVRRIWETINNFNDPELQTP